MPEPEPGGLVMRVEAALTCGTDVKTLRRGHPVMIPRVPTVFGHELAGVVTAVGQGAPGVKEGDRVVAAQLGALRAMPLLHGRAVRISARTCSSSTAPTASTWRCPRAWSPGTWSRSGPGWPRSSAAFAEPLACALLGIERGRIEPGMTVAIWGHGPLGCLLALAARQRGARVIVVGKTGWRLDRVRALGLGTSVDALTVPDMPGAPARPDRGPGARCHGGRDRPAGGLGAGH